MLFPDRVITKLGLEWICSLHGGKGHRSGDGMQKHTFLVSNIRENSYLQNTITICSNDLVAETPSGNIRDNQNPVFDLPGHGRFPICQ